MLSKINGVPPSELMVDLYLSTYCNFKCHYCYVMHSPTAPCSMTQLGIDAVMQALGHARHPVNLYILGGEPTIVPTLGYAIERAKQCENIKHINVFTNGSRRLQHIDGVRYIVSIHPASFRPAHLKNFIDIDNKEVKMMYDPAHLGQAARLTDFLIDNGIDVITDYIHYGNMFDIGPRVHDIEGKPRYMFNGIAVSLRDVIKRDLWDARNFKCFQNEISVAPNLEIQQFCNPYKTHDPSYIANFEIKLMPCRFKRKCACFEQVKL